MKKKSKMLILLLSLMMILSACGNKDNGSKQNEGSKSNTSSGEKTEAKSNFEEGRVDGVLDVCIASEPNSIDPALNSSVDGATMITHLFEGLVKFEDDGTGNAVLKPGIAESWDVSDDGLKYTFHLRDAKWTDGKPVTAKDFVFAWNRLVNPTTGADYEYMLDMVKQNEDKTLEISAPDDKTFVVNLNVKCPYFEEICAFPACMPVREDVVKNETWTTKGETLICNGPYKMETWDHNSQLILVKNEEYYDQDAVNAEKINFHLQDDQNAIYAAYRSGDLDFIESVPQEEVKPLIESGELIISKYIGTYFVCFNTQKAPFDNPDVRRAFSLAIDRNFIVDNVTGQGQLPAGAYVPPGVYDKDGANGKDFRSMGKAEYFSVKPEDYEKNVEEAKKLLEKAGYKDGEGFPQIEYLYNTSESHKAIAEALQNMWQEKLGVTVTLQNQDWNVFQTNRKQGNYDIARHGWISDYNDPMSFIDMWLTGGGNNDAQYKNPEYDKLVKEAKATSDQAKRMEDMHKAEDILIGEDSVVAPIYYYNNAHMVKPNIKGIYYTPLGYFFFKGATGF